MPPHPALRTAVALITGAAAVWALAPVSAVPAKVPAQMAGHEVTAVNDALRVPGGLINFCPRVEPAPAKGLPVSTTTAVIPGLDAMPAHLDAWDSVSTVAGGSTVLYRRDQETLTPIATLPRSLGWEPGKPQPVVVVVRDTACGLDKVLASARQSVPSAANKTPAQTTAWVLNDEIGAGWVTPDRIVIDRAKKKLTVIDSTGRELYSTSVVVGAPRQTPTPEATSYLLSAYRDGARQPETENAPILLTSAHSSRLSSYAANSGEVGIHFMRRSAGNASHGCIRVPTHAAAERLGKLPPGTPVIVR